MEKAKQEQQTLIKMKGFGAWSNQAGHSKKWPDYSRGGMTSEATDQINYAERTAWIYTLMSNDKALSLVEGMPIFPLQAIYLNSEQIRKLGKESEELK